MKKIIIALFCCSIILSSATTVNAVSHGYTDVKESNDVFENYLDNANIEEISVINNEGKVVENEISNEISQLLLKGDREKVLELLIRYDLSLSYSEEESIGLRSIGSEVTRTVRDFHVGYDTSRSLSKEWVTAMRIRYRENPDGTLTAFGNPAVSTEINFGSAFSEEVTNMQSSYRYVNNRTGIEYYGSYRLRARLILPIEIGDIEIPLGKWYDWGTTHFNYIQR